MLLIKGNIELIKDIVLKQKEKIESSKRNESVIGALGFVQVV